MGGGGSRVVRVQGPAESDPRGGNGSQQVAWVRIRARRGTRTKLHHGTVPFYFVRLCRALIPPTYHCQLMEHTAMLETG